MKDVVFVSVAFGPQYIAQQMRLMKSILAIHPDANLMFWSDEYPPASKTMEMSLYGFKVHAIFEAKKKFQKVVWVDTAMILMDKIDDLLVHPVVAVRDDNKLYNLISYKASLYFGIPQEEIEKLGWHLVGGSLYFFDFNTPEANLVFRKWYLAEFDGMFGSQHESASELINGHRHDEACMAVCLYHFGYNPLTAEELRYGTENNPMFIKKHFK